MHGAGGRGHPSTVDFVFKIVRKDNLKDVTVAKAPKRGPASIKETRVPAPPACVVAAAASAAFADPADARGFAVAHATAAAGLAAAKVLQAAMAALAAPGAPGAAMVDVPERLEAADADATAAALAAVLPMLDGADGATETAIRAAVDAMTRAVVADTTSLGVRSPIAVGRGRIALPLPNLAGIILRETG